MESFFKVFIAWTVFRLRGPNSERGLEIVRIYRCSVAITIILLILGCNSSRNGPNALTGRNDQIIPKLDRETPVPTDMSKAGLHTVYDIISRNPVFSEIFDCSGDSMKEYGPKVAPDSGHTWFVPVNTSCRDSVDIHGRTIDDPTAEGKLLSVVGACVVKGELDIANMFALVRDSLSPPLKSVSGIDIRPIGLSGDSIGIVVGKDTAHGLNSNERHQIGPLSLLF